MLQTPATTLEVFHTWKNDISSGVVALLIQENTLQHAWFDSSLSFKGALDVAFVSWPGQVEWEAADRDADGRWELLACAGPLGAVIRLSPGGAELAGAWVCHGVPEGKAEVAANWAPARGGAWTIVSRVLPTPGNSCADYGQLRLDWTRDGIASSRGAFGLEVDVWRGSSSRLSSNVVADFLLESAVTSPWRVMFTRDDLPDALRAENWRRHREPAE